VSSKLYSSKRFRITDERLGKTSRLRRDPTGVGLALKNRTMSMFDYLRNSEQSIYDFNTPWSMAIVVLGFLSAWLVTNILEHLGITRHLWHLPLFFAALAVLFGSLAGLFFAP